MAWLQCTYRLSTTPAWGWGQDLDVSVAPYDENSFLIWPAQLQIQHPQEHRPAYAMVQTRPEGHYHVDAWPVKPEHEHERTPAAIAIHLGHDGHNAFIVACEQHPAGSALAGGAPTGLLSTDIIIIASLLGGHLGVSHQECEASHMQPGVGHVIPCVYASVAGQHHLIVITVQHPCSWAIQPFL